MRKKQERIDDAQFNASEAIPTAPSWFLGARDIFKRQKLPRLTQREMQDFLDQLERDMPNDFESAIHNHIKVYRWKALSGK